MLKKLTCINCPVGCGITAEFIDGKVVSVSGNKCERGRKYAEEELTHPLRILTTTIYIPERDTMLPVRSNRPIPKEKLINAVPLVKNIAVTLPVRMGQVLLADIEGADMIASRDMD